MEAFLKFRKRALPVGNERGQTTVEYLLLLAMVFTVSYIMITGPFSTFTKLMLATIRSGINNTVRNGEWTPGTVAGPGDPAHPSNPKRLKAVHL